MLKELPKYLVVGAGGFVGANARYALGQWISSRWGAAFPYGTLVINLSGCFILGLFATLSLELAWNDYWRLLVAMGFVGAYTTFSTFEYESLRLITDGGNYASAAINILGSVSAGFVAAYGGVVAARLLCGGR